MARMTLPGVDCTANERIMARIISEKEQPATMQTQVNEACSRIDMYTDRVVGLLNELEARLHPVLETPFPCDVSPNEGPKKNLVPLAYSLQTFADRIDGITARLEDITNRLQV